MEKKYDKQEVQRKRQEAVRGICIGLKLPAHSIEKTLSYR